MHILNEDIGAIASGQATPLLTVLYTLTMTKMTVAKDDVAMLGEKTGKSVIAFDVLLHAMGDEEDAAWVVVFFVFPHKAMDLGFLITAQKRERFARDG